MMMKTKNGACTFILLAGALILTACGPNDEAGTQAQGTGKQAGGPGGGATGMVQKESGTTVTPAKSAGEMKAEKREATDVLAEAGTAERFSGATAVKNVKLEGAGEGETHEGHSHEAPVAAQVAPGDPGAAPPPMPSEPGPEAYFVTAETTTVDMGEIPTNEYVSKICKLTNTSDKPATIVRVQGSCGCTAVNIPPNTVLQPKETREMEIKVHGNPTPAPFVGKTVTVIVEGQPPITLKLTGTIVQFVKTEPAVLDMTTNADGKLKVISVDGTAFKITKMSPDIGLKFEGMEAATSHEVTLDWGKYKALPGFQPTYLYLDHPKCQQVLVQISFPPGTWPAPPMAVNKGDNTLIPNPNPSGRPAPPVQNEPLAPVIAMIRANDAAGLMGKIKEGMSIESADRNGTTLLGIAAQEGKVDVLKELLKGGADINAVDRNGRTPLMAAAKSKNPEVFYTLLDAGANVELRDQIGTTALSWTAMLGTAECVQALIDAGADVNVVTTTTGWSPLIWAAGFGDPASIPLLVKAGANLEVADNLDGSTALIHAARTGKAESLAAMLKTAAKLESPDNNGKTAFLSCAATSGGTAEKLKMLVDAGANVHAKDSRKENALQWARKRTDKNAEAIRAYLEPLLGSETPLPSAEEPAGATAVKPTGTFVPASQPAAKPAEPVEAKPSGQ